MLARHGYSSSFAGKEAARVLHSLQQHHHLSWLSCSSIIGWLADDVLRQASRHAVVKAKRSPVHLSSSNISSLEASLTSYFIPLSVLCAVRVRRNRL